MNRIRLFPAIILISILFSFFGCYDQADLLINKNQSFNQITSKMISLPNGITMEELAYNWAPIHYQDIYSVNGDGSRADYITRMDRGADGAEGGEWNLNNNWDKDLNYSLRAYVYYSVVETESHYYITYSFFHPWDTAVRIDLDILDWKKKEFTIPTVLMFSINGLVKLLTNVDGPSELTMTLPYPVFKFKQKRYFEKRNDMEGVLFVVNKLTDPNLKYGTLEAVFSQAHGYLQTYLTAEGSDKLNARSERVRPFIVAPVADPAAFASMNDDVKRIITTQEAQGHGAGCYPDWGSPSPGHLFDLLTLDKRHANKSPIEKLVEKESGGDHIRYIPTKGDPEEPIYGDIPKGGYTYCKYKLINIFDENGLWANRKNPAVFEQNEKKPISFMSAMIGGHGDAFWSWHGSKEGQSMDAMEDLAAEKVHEGCNWINARIDAVLAPILDSWAGQLTTEAVSSLFGALGNRLSDLMNFLDFLNEKRQSVADEYEKNRTRLQKLIATINEFTDSIGNKVADIGVIKMGIDIMKFQWDTLQSSIASLGTILANTAQVIYTNVQQWFWKRWGGFWGWVTHASPNSAWYATNDSINQKSAEASQINASITAEQSKLAQIESQQKEEEMKLMSYTKEMSSQEAELAELDYQKSNIIDQIGETQKKINIIKSIMSTSYIASQFLTSAVIKFIMEPINQELYKLITMKEEKKQELKELLMARYRDMHLTTEEAYFVDASHRPWSHNPAHLCWVYIKPKNGDTTTYFKDMYVSNLFMDDLLKSPNFKYENGISVPIQ